MKIRPRRLATTANNRLENGFSQSSGRPVCALEEKKSGMSQIDRPAGPNPSNIYDCRKRRSPYFFRIFAPAAHRPARNPTRRCDTARPRPPSRVNEQVRAQNRAPAETGVDEPVWRPSRRSLCQCCFARLPRPGRPGTPAPARALRRDRGSRDAPAESARGNPVRGLPRRSRSDFASCIGVTWIPRGGERSP